MEKERKSVSGYKPGGGGKLQAFARKGQYTKESKSQASSSENAGYRQNTDYRSILENDKRREAVKKYSDDPGRDIGKMGLNRSPVKAVGFARRDTKNHRDHAKEMGLNQREYEREAIRFFNSNKGDLYKSDQDGKFYRYDPKTRTVAISLSNGEICSFYIANKKWFDGKKKDWRLIK